MESYPEHDDIVRILESYGEVIFSTEFGGIGKCTVRSILYKPIVMGYSPYHRDNYTYINVDTGKHETPAEASYHELFYAMLHTVENIEEDRY